MKINSSRNNSKSVWYLYVILLLLSIFCTYLMVKKPSNSSVCDEKKYLHLNPQIVCETELVVNKKNYVEFKRELQAFIESIKEKGDAKVVSVYFRDLRYGPTFGIDEYEKFSPASLLKLPMMIAYLGIYESEDPGILQKELSFTGYNNDLMQSIPPKYSALENTNYSVFELLEYLIKYSDNNSYYALLDYINIISPNTQLLRDTFIDLGVIDPKSNLDETITVKSYAGIFTQLFNSTYFSEKETSEIALDLLTNTDYVRGIVVGVPVGTKVAHKFGERFDESTNLKQLHDCGVIYYPKNPYLLCIMTKGDDMSKLEKIISEISKLTYKEFDSRKI